MNLAESQRQILSEQRLQKTGISSRSELRKINFGSGENSEERRLAQETEKKSHELYEKSWLFTLQTPAMLIELSIVCFFV